MQHRKNESPATHLLISMLIRYPEVSSVRFEPQTQSLVFSFFLQGSVDTSKQAACLQELEVCFAVCTDLDRQFPKLGNLTFTPYQDITNVTYHQSIHRIRTSEIRLLIGLLQRHFDKQLALDPLVLADEDLEMQEELIDRLLGQSAFLLEEKLIVAYRDGGKVFVYNR